MPKPDNKQLNTPTPREYKDDTGADERVSKGKYKCGQ